MIFSTTDSFNIHFKCSSDLSSQMHCFLGVGTIFVIFLKEVSCPRQHLFNSFFIYIYYIYLFYQHNYSSLQSHMILQISTFDQC